MYCAEGQVKRNRKPQVDLVAPGVLGSVSSLFSDVDVRRRLHHRGERHRHLRHRGERHRHRHHRHYSAEHYRHYHEGH